MNSDDRAALEELGWNERFASAFDALGNESLQPGRLAADYGTKFLVCAGLLNILAMIDAYEIAVGKKP